MILENTLLSHHDTSCFSTADICKRFNISRDTLRYYEKEQLIPPSLRQENQYRYYTNIHLTAIHAILSYKTLGLSLNHIKQLIHCPPSLNEFQELLQKQSDCLVQELKEIQCRLSCIHETIATISKHLTKLHDHKILQDFSIAFNKLLDLQDLPNNPSSCKHAPHTYHIHLLEDRGSSHYLIRDSAYLTHHHHDFSEAMPYNITFPHVITFSTDLPLEDLHEQINAIKHQYAHCYTFKPLFYYIKLIHLPAVSSIAPTTLSQVLLPFTPIKN
ncbi:MAG: MerR family transcriptional regulator [Cellulosilyticaceae bacterium]